MVGRRLRYEALFFSKGALQRSQKMHGITEEAIRLCFLQGLDECVRYAKPVRGAVPSEHVLCVVGI